MNTFACRCVSVGEWCCWIALVKRLGWGQTWEQGNLMLEMSDVFFHLRARGLSLSHATSSDMEAWPLCCSISCCVCLTTSRGRRAQVQQLKASVMFGNGKTATSMSRNLYLEGWKKKRQTKWTIEMNGAGDLTIILRATSYDLGWNDWRKNRQISQEV